MKFVLSTSNSVTELTQLRWKHSSQLHYNVILTDKALLPEGAGKKQNSSSSPVTLQLWSLSSNLFRVPKAKGKFNLRCKD